MWNCFSDFWNRTALSYDCHYCKAKTIVMFNKFINGSSPNSISRRSLSSATGEDNQSISRSIKERGLSARDTAGSAETKPQQNCWYAVFHSPPWKKRATINVAFSLFFWSNNLRLKSFINMKLIEWFIHSFIVYLFDRLVD